MTKMRKKNGIMKGLLLVLVMVTMLGGILSYTLTAAAQEVQPTAEPTYTSNVYFDYKEVLTAPIAITTDEGTYYQPTAYVYFGRAYNSSTGSYMPILHRVLDPEHDNAGGSGAIFVLAENVINNSRFSIYTDDNTANYLGDENSYVDSNLIRKAYSALYTAYETAYVNANTVGTLPQELDYVREITKIDSASAVDGYFGLSSQENGYYWTVVDADGEEVGQLPLLENARVFPLSVEEVYKYLGNARFGTDAAKVVFSATDIRNGTLQAWWLRTAVGDAIGSGSMVGIVGTDGGVTYSSAQDTLANRNALNIENDEIVFVERIEDNIYRLAFNAPEYKSGDQLEATLVDVKDGRVTVDVRNHIGQNGWTAVGESVISYIVTDASGRAKYYGVADGVKTKSGATEKLDLEERFSFALPECYEQGDKIKVFWERREYSYQSYTTYVSNMVELGCIHTTEGGGSPAYCHQRAVCGVCHNYYGSEDKNNHRDVIERWQYNEGEGTHSRHCTLCDAAVYTEKCNFGPNGTDNPVSCVYNNCNGCGHEVDATSLHNYGSNGICTQTTGENHYEMPTLENYANIGFTVRISTVGEWNALAQWLNSGGYYIRLNEQKSIILTADLDFSGIEFIPIGTEERPAKNLDIEAHHRTIKGIRYTADGNSPVGIIGVGDKIRVLDLIITDSEFSGNADAGAVVGRLLADEKNSSDFRNIAVINVTIDAPRAGGIVGTLENDAELSSSFVYNVTSDGVDLDFSYDGKLSLLSASSDGEDLYGGCYRLADEGNGADAVTLEDFASGMVTYRLRRLDPRWRQNIGTDAYPYYAKDGDDANRVYRVVSCDGDNVVYMNENIGQVSHGEFIDYDAASFAWIDGIGDFGVGFSISVKCGLCEKYTTVEHEAKASFYYSFTGRFIARSEFDAYLDFNGGSVKINSEPKVIYGIALEDLIGMTPISLQYDGSDHYASSLFTNLRDGLVYGYDFKAYFLDPVTGEKITEIEYDYYGRPQYVPAGIRDVGVYDVLIVGIDGYEGYEYKYEDVFEIKKSTVTITPLDLIKVYDGTADFELEYELDGDEVYNLWFDISIEKASSAAIGKYTLKITADLNSHDHADNITLTLLRDEITAVIAPDKSIKIENKSYPESFVYGDTIPVPTASHFDVSADAKIEYQWFAAGYDYYTGYYPSKKIDAPKDAGDYILRVIANSKDGSMISGSLDLYVSIVPKKLNVELTPPKNAEIKIKDEYNGEIVYLYILNEGDVFSYNVNGFVYGDTLESTGIQMDVYLRGENGGYIDEGPSSGHPVLPSSGAYRAEFHLSGNSNYESNVSTVYISIRKPEYTYPVETEFVADGNPISPNMLVPGLAVGFTPDGEEFDYVINVKGPSGDVILTKNGYGAISLSEVYLYNAATHTYYDHFYGVNKTERGVFAEAGKYTVSTEIRNANSVQTYEYSFVIEFYNADGEQIDRIVDPGVYTVRVYSLDSTVPKEATVYAQQRIVMNLKPHEYNLSEGKVEFDPKKVIMEAGNVIHLDHTLVEVYFDVRDRDGKIYASGLKVVDKNGRDVSILYIVETDIPSWPSHEDAINICHIFDNPCDPDCNIEGCEYTRAVEHRGGVSTCQSLAVCDICGLCYGEYSTERHIGTKTLVYPNLDDLEVSHLIVYSCCGATKKIVQHTHVTPATCTELAVCSECGWSYGELDPNNHSSNECTYEEKDGYHVKIHSCCGLAENEDHSGGTAYCNSLTVCEYCNGRYGVTDPENHAKAPVYTPDQNDATMHTEYYACCEKTSSYAHFGGDAKCNAKAVCTDCKTAYGELDPHDHASDELRYERDMDNPSLHDIYHACCDLYIDKEFHTGGTATCISPAICELCANAYGEKDYRNHASDSYAYYPLPDDPELHVKVAACCGEFAGNEAHSYGEPTCTHAARCACGAEIGETIEHVYDNACDAVCNTCGKQTRATSFHVGKDGHPCEICGVVIPKEPMSGGAVAAIATASAVTASTGGFALFWFIIKKKSLSELIALLFK